MGKRRRRERAEHTDDWNELLQRIETYTSLKKGKIIRAEGFANVEILPTFSRY